jgi:hypothetical protein
VDGGFAKTSRYMVKARSTKREHLSNRMLVEPHINTLKGRPTSKEDDAVIFI